MRAKVLLVLFVSETLGSSTEDIIDNGLGGVWGHCKAVAFGTWEESRQEILDAGLALSIWRLGTPVKTSRPPESYLDDFLQTGNWKRTKVGGGGKDYSVLVGCDFPVASYPYPSCPCTFPKPKAHCPLQSRVLLSKNRLLNWPAPLPLPAGPLQSSLLCQQLCWELALSPHTPRITLF